MPRSAPCCGRALPRTWRRAGSRCMRRTSCALMLPPQWPARRLPWQATCPLHHHPHRGTPAAAVAALAYAHGAARGGGAFFRRAGRARLRAADRARAALLLALACHGCAARLLLPEAGCGFCGRAPRAPRRAASGSAGARLPCGARRCATICRPPAARPKRLQRLACRRTCGRRRCRRRRCWRCTAAWAMAECRHRRVGLAAGPGGRPARLWSEHQNPVPARGEKEQRGVHERNGSGPARFFVMVFYLFE